MKNLIRSYMYRSGKLAHAVSATYAVLLIIGMLGGGASIGFLYAWHKSEGMIETLQEEYRATIDQLAVDVALAAHKNADAASRIGEAAEIARDAVMAAKRASSAASVATKEAREAAHLAREASSLAHRPIIEAVPPEPEPVKKPDPFALGTGG